METFKSAERKCGVRNQRDKAAKSHEVKPREAPAITSGSDGDISISEITAASDPKTAPAAMVWGDPR